MDFRKIKKESICRICMQSESIRDWNELCEYSGMSLKDCYIKYTQLKVFDSDPFPQFLCVNCFSELQSFHFLVQMAIETQQVLEQKVADLSESFAINGNHRINQVEEEEMKNEWTKELELLLDLHDDEDKSDISSCNDTNYNEVGYTTEYLSENSNEYAVHNNFKNIDEGNIEDVSRGNESFAVYHERNKLHKAKITWQKDNGFTEKIRAKYKNINQNKYINRKKNMDDFKKYASDKRHEKMEYYTEDDLWSESESAATARESRTRNPQSWKANIRKHLRESGKSYTSANNKKVPAKKMKAPCNKNCFLECSNVFTEEERMHIFQTFWNMTDQEKNNFYIKFVTQNLIKKRRTKSVAKQITFYYHFEKNQSMQRVCRTFFMNTLGIHIRRIYYTFSHLYDVDKGVPLPRRKGKNVKRVTAPNKLSEIREHILSFDTCQHNSTKTFNDTSLNLTRMYNIYTQKYPNPVGIHIYRKVFKSEFNISFQNSKRKL